MSTEEPRPTGRVEAVVGAVRNAITLPLVVAVLGAVAMLVIAAVIAGSLGSP